MPRCKGKTGEGRNLVIFKDRPIKSNHINGKLSTFFIDMIVDRLIKKIQRKRLSPGSPSYPKQVRDYLKQEFKYVENLTCKPDSAQGILPKIRYLLFVKEPHSRLGRASS